MQRIARISWRGKKSLAISFVKFVKINNNAQPKFVKFVKFVVKKEFAKLV